MQVMNMPTPIITGNQVDSSRNARIILAFFDAYNASQLDAALALMDEQGQISDCDFQANRPVLFRGKSQIAHWLRQRFADHDQLIVRKIDAGNSVVGVEFAGRISDTLRRLGYPDGITPNLVAKVVMKWGGSTIDGIALGPGFHSTNTCYSAFGITS
jgi:hypothetical protein